MRILVADDDRLSSHILKTSLEPSGYEVIHVSDGARAWEVLQSENAPKLAILDWMMPSMDGLEVCRRVRQAGGPYVYILLLTANSSADEVVAGINAGADDYIKKPFNPEELRARLRTGLRIVELEERLRIEATHDHLTGLLNRAAIVERLQIELQRAERENAPLSLAMADLDFFKRVNDTHGHEAGDNVLRETAHRMRAMVRPYDLIGRWGGEEFVIVFPRCDTAQAIAVAERVRRFVDFQPMDTGTRKIYVTMSMGVADTTGFSQGDALVRAADKALFKAKDGGRNRIETMSLLLEKGARAT